MQVNYRRSLCCFLEATLNCLQCKKWVEIVFPYQKIIFWHKLHRAEFQNTVYFIVKLFETRSISRAYSVIFRVRVVLRRTVVGDWRFDNLSGRWLWRWLPLRLSKRQSPITVLRRTTLTQMITLYDLLSILRVDLRIPILSWESPPRGGQQCDMY